MAVRVRIPASLRELAGGRAELALELRGAGTVTVGAVLDQLAVDCPALERRVRDEQGNVRRHVNVFVGTDNIRDLGGLATPLPAGAELSILPAVSGG